MKSRYAKTAPERFGEDSATFARLAMAAADIDAAFKMALGAATRIDEAKEPAAFSVDERSIIRRDIAYAAHKACNTVNNMFRANGGSGIYESQPLQRLWRDINAGAVHVVFNWDSIATSFGRAFLNLPLAPGDQPK